MGHVSRRHFPAGGLAGTAVAGLGAAAATGCSDSTSGRDGGDTSTGGGTARPGARYLPFRGPHQTGISHPAHEQGLLAAFTVTADNRDELRETLRALTTESERRATRGTLALRWMLGGYNGRTRAARGEAGKRNLMGFIDGTSNLDPSDDAVMDRYVWVQPGDDEPAWTAGGAYHVVRVIRMLVEFWDRTRLSEQESIIGRRKESGAPLGGEVETDVPDYAADALGALTPLDAHIRLANPRTSDTEGDLIFRSGLSFSRGFDGDGQLDQGLAFVSFQRRLSQFINTQARLRGEPLEEYIVPEGGGFYFALPGVLDDGRFLGEDLFA
jgi:deferrochelatase/peroxidase EfeB